VGASAIARKLKEISHLEWLDLSGNLFNGEEGIITQIMQGIKNQKNLFHFGLSMAPTTSRKEAFKCSEQMISLLVANPKLVSICMDNSFVTPHAMAMLEKLLRQPNRKIANLSFKYCFLDGTAIVHLCNGLAVNRSLVSLSLSSNGLSSLSGTQIVRALSHNIYLTNLDLSRNNLGDEFAVELAKCLSSNDILWRVDISHNPITARGAEALLKVLRENNDTLTSLGDIEANLSMGVLTIRNINICLGTNRDNADGQHNKQTERDKHTQEPVELQTRLMIKDNSKVGTQTDYGGYKIMKPLSYVNNPVKTLGDFQMWNI